MQNYLVASVTNSNKTYTGGWEAKLCPPTPVKKKKEREKEIVSVASWEEKQ